jgi:uncharacterized membrane protein
VAQYRKNNALFSGGSFKLRKHKRQLNAWGIPALYAVIAIAAALTLPRFEGRIFPGLISPLSVSAASAIYAAIASGMIALTGIVFSLTFVMVQFSATAYSPRLVLWIARDPVISHALGMFTATFLFAIAALSGVDRNASGKVPFVSAWMENALLLASVGMFIALIHRIGLLQVNRMLVFTGEQGRKVITTLYPVSNLVGPAAAAVDLRALPLTQTLIHHGRPRAIQAVDVAWLVQIAEASGGVIEMLGAVGDTVLESTPLLHVYGVEVPVDEEKLRTGIELGEERTFEQDPKYAIRLLVDIAIKALSPAINDPTTAVQALDQIEDLLLRMGRQHLEIGKYHGSSGELRLIVPFPSWDDLLRLAFDEISAYGATSVQVMRRMNALLADLARAVPEERRPTVHYWSGRLKAMIARSFVDDEQRVEALKEDRQGLGVPRHEPST